MKERKRAEAKRVARVPLAFSRFGAAIAIHLAVGAALLALVGASPVLRLAITEAMIKVKWGEVSHLSLDAVAALLSAAPNDVALFDVREADEFAVSHLPGALRVDPTISAEDFLAHHGGAAAGKPIVFYCSVGVRSAQLASRVRARLGADLVAGVGGQSGRVGSDRVHNLSGGIFGWHNRRLPLVDGAGPTKTIHGFDRRWSRLLIRQLDVRR